MPEKFLKFPDNFRWGTATASYQIEGACHEDGKGESIWDRFSHTPGKIQGGDTGDVTCDHYHLYKEDVKNMKKLSHKTYRFSISWPRVLPEGKGMVNEAGLDFYDRLVDELLKAGIEPFITLYHWDLPQALQEEGGWANRDTIGHFADYAALVAQRLGDRVHHWITHNEPREVSFKGYSSGIHAPGIKHLATAVQVSHHLLFSHGRAVEVLRNLGSEKTRVGITLSLYPVHPASQKKEDIEAAKKWDGHLNRWFLDPVFKGDYPPDMWEHYQDNIPKVLPGDMNVISRKIDFLGINYYFRIIVKADPADKFLGVSSLMPKGAEYTDIGGEVYPEGIDEILKRVQIKPEDAEYTDTGWEVYPQGIYEILKRVQNDYAPQAIYITENGAAFSDKLDKEGKIKDDRRINYLKEHLRFAHQAIEEGVKLKGYFIWSLMDNFEWASGYSKRFGLIYMDYLTQKRIFKESAYWYKRVIDNNGIKT